ncbi:hypothetical protein AJ88_47495 [Mesorhizobium amorphae CCBAU 01583]|nr:hypothetical protein AJ88_47495 [Mesorhizobium amorphae CCBAU 01583]
MPDTADPPRIVKADANSEPVMRLAVTSDTMSVQDMTVIVQDQIEDELAAVPGVADVQVSGDRDKTSASTSTRTSWPATASPSPILEQHWPRSPSIRRPARSPPPTRT